MGGERVLFTSDIIATEDSFHSDVDHGVLLFFSCNTHTKAMYDNQSIVHRLDQTEALAMFQRGQQLLFQQIATRIMP